MSAAADGFVASVISKAVPMSWSRKLQTRHFYFARSRCREGDVAMDDEEEAIKERVMTFGNRKRRNPWFAWTRKNLGLLFHALVAVHHTVVGGHHSSVDSRS